jgi:hypothetical protein
LRLKIGSSQLLWTMSKSHHAQVKSSPIWRCLLWEFWCSLKLCMGRGLKLSGPLGRPQWVGNQVSNLEKWKTSPTVRGGDQIAYYSMWKPSLWWVVQSAQDDQYRHWKWLC